MKEIPLEIVLNIITLFFGLCVGSFLNVCIYRIPRDISVVSPRSFCPTCGAEIPWYHNIPVLSWLWLRGRAACCATKINVRYPMVELLTASLFLMIVNRYPLPMAIVYIVFSSLMIIGFFTDLDHLIIPNRVTLGGLGAGLICSALLPELHETNLWWLALGKSFFGAVLGAGILWAVAIVGSYAFKKEAMGMGDVKLLACIGSFLGWQAVLFTIAVGSVIGSIAGLTWLLLKNRRWVAHTMIPFGPPLMIAALGWILGGRRLWELYFARL